MSQGFRWLELATTKYLILTVCLVFSSVMLLLVITLFVKAIDSQAVNTFVDSLLKATALIGGSAWALNRYFTGRTDAPQLRVEPTLSLIPAKRFSKDRPGSLLIYRLDILNTGRTLLIVEGQFVEVSAVVADSESVNYAVKSIYRWPADGYHPGPQIEPSSWSAVTDAIPIESDVQVVQLYLEILSKNKVAWNWHRFFDLHPERSQDISQET